MGRNLIAVYGTLKEGYFNYDAYLKGEKPIDRGFVALPFRMYANADYPMIIASEERNPIWIEIFDLDDEKLRELDELEAPYGYWRESVHLDELSKRVEIYVHGAPAPPGFCLVDSGDWRG